MAKNLAASWPTIFTTRKAGDRPMARHLLRGQRSAHATNGPFTNGILIYRTGTMRRPNVRHRCEEVGSSLSLSETLRNGCWRRPDASDWQDCERLTCCAQATCRLSDCAPWASLAT